MLEREGKSHEHTMFKIPKVYNLQSYGEKKNVRAWQKGAKSDFVLGRGQRHRPISNSERGMAWEKSVELTKETVSSKAATQRAGGGQLHCTNSY